MRSTSAVLIAFAAIMLAPTGAFAQTSVEYPFCAQGSKASEGSTRCDFATLAQCQAWIAGGSGSCVPNPRAAQGAPRQQNAAPAGRR
jgi:Protein of unknown function (DUF3551)